MFRPKMAPAKKDDDYRRPEGFMFFPWTIWYMLYNKNTRKPTILAWILMLVSLFFMIRHNLPSIADDGNEDQVVKAIRDKGGLNPRFKPNPQLEEFETMRKKIQAGQELDFVVFDPNLQEGNDDEEKKSLKSLVRPSPKVYPVDLLLQPRFNELCGDQRSLHILFVVIASEHAQMAHDNIRRTWANGEFDGKRWSTLFVTGIADHEKMGENIKREASSHMDILQLAIPQNANEGTRKFMAARDWIVEKMATYCQVDFILRMPETVFPNPPVLIQYLSRFYQPAKPLYVGSKMKKLVPVRRPEKIMYIPEADYPKFLYPDLVGLPLYLMSYEGLRKTYDVRDQVTPIALEEGYVGITVNVAGFKPTNDDKFRYVPRRSMDKCGLVKMLFLFDVTPIDHLKLSNSMIEAKKEC